MQRTQLREVPGWLLAEGCLPVRRQRTRATREQNRDPASRYSNSGSKKHSLEHRSCSRPPPCQSTISSVQKNTRELPPACILKSEMDLRVSPVSLLPG